MGMRTGTKRVVAAAMVGMAALGLAGSLWAQNTEVPERGFQPTGSYRLSDIETVNTKNGNVMLTGAAGGIAPSAGRQPGLSAHPQLQQQAVGCVRRAQETNMGLTRPTRRPAPEGLRCRRLPLPVRLSRFIGS